MVRKVRIEIRGEPFEARADDSILRALQEYGIACQLPDYGFTRFCWNASCGQCVLMFDRGDGVESGFACQTQVCAGLRIISLPAVLCWKRVPTRP